MNLNTFTSFEGRIGRKTWWLSKLLLGLLLLIPYAIILGVLFATTDMAAPQPMPSTMGIAIASILGLVTLFFVLWVSFALDAKRWHDHGKSGWYTLFSLVPFVNIWAFIKTGFLRGTEGPNQYGNDPVRD